MCIVQSAIIHHKISNGSLSHLCCAVLVSSSRAMICFIVTRKDIYVRPMPQPMPFSPVSSLMNTSSLTFAEGIITSNCFMDFQFRRRMPTNERRNKLFRVALVSNDIVTFAKSFFVYFIYYYYRWCRLLRQRNHLFLSFFCTLCASVNWFNNITCTTQHQLQHIP